MAARRVPIDEDDAPHEPESAYAELTHALEVARLRYGIAPSKLLPGRMLGDSPAWQLAVWDASTSIILELGPYKTWGETCPRALAELRRQGLVR